MMTSFTHVGMLVLVSTLLFVLAARCADGTVCFRKYHEGKGACKGVTKSTGDAATCCGKHGQGHAVEAKRIAHSKKWYECVPCDLKADEGEGLEGRVLQSTVRRAEKGHSKVMDRHATHPSPPNHGQSPAMTAEQGMVSRGWGVVLSGGGVHVKHNVAHVDENSKSKLMTHTALANNNDVWSPWSEWGPCSKTCDGGLHQRTRFCLKDKCTGEDFQERPCANLNPCIVDGHWNDWTEWLPCTATCGNGTESRLRACNNPVPQNGGHDCVGSSSEIRQCNLPVCPVDGKWSDWSDWSVCNVTCGEGSQARHRACDNPRPSDGGYGCDGADIERRPCEITCPVDGRWSVWTNWTSCSATCGEGTQTRTRRCDAPRPEHDGKPCQGLELESMPCGTATHCSVDGNWTEWSHVDSCSAKPCSGEAGYKTRFRSCINPRPMYGGRPCQGRSWKRELCYNNDFCTEKVDGGWCLWSNWTECRYGFSKRQRTCECPPAVNGGSKCQGSDADQKVCGGILDKKPILLADNKGREGCHDSDGSGDGSDVTCDDEPEVGAVTDETEAADATNASGDDQA